jgi:hypothetical protein
MAASVDEGRLTRSVGEAPQRVGGKDSSTAGGDGKVEGSNEVRFTIPLAFPSVNSLHQIIYSQRRVELKPEVRRWKNDAKEHIPRFAPRSQSSLLRVDVVFHYPFYYANGKLREFDTHNAVKPLLDVIAEKLNFNDKRVKCGSWDSVDSVDEKVEIHLKEIA